MSRTVELEWDRDRKQINYLEGVDTVAPVGVDIPGRGPIVVRASVHSLAGILGALARELSRRLPWTASATAGFILLGVAPDVVPLAMSWEHLTGLDFERSVVTLRVEPWVPRDVVAVAYREAQRELLAGPNHAVRPRSAELARFLATDAQNVSIREQMRRWNERHPDWAERDPRNFQGRAERAKKLILNPKRGPGVRSLKESPPPRLRLEVE